VDVRGRIAILAYSHAISLQSFGLKDLRIGNSAAKEPNCKKNQSDFEREISQSENPANPT
jgi:hypothetical protein